MSRNEEISFEQASDNFRSAFGGMVSAALASHEEVAKELIDAAEPVITKIVGMAQGVRAAKRKARREELVRQKPEVGTEVVVDICPDDICAETWMQIGEVAEAWIHDDPDSCDPLDWHLWAVVTVTRQMTPLENEHDYQSDDRWNGCKFVCRMCFSGEDWRAKFPVNDIARERWGTIDGEE